MFARLPPDMATMARLESLLRGLGTATAGLVLVLIASPSARGGLGVWLQARGAPDGSERALVARVVDGDTLVLADGRTVRVLGVDTPETANPSLSGAQPLGPEATAQLRALTAGRTVTLERDTTDQDHYGRLLRHVWRGRSLVAETLVQAGLGRAYIIPPDTRHAARLRAAEDAARAAGRGLWGLPRPTPLPVFGTPGP